MCNLYNDRKNGTIGYRGRTAAKLKRRNDQNGTTSGSTCRRNTMILRAGWWLNQHSQVVLLHEISQFNTLNSRKADYDKPPWTTQLDTCTRISMHQSYQSTNWVVLPSRLQKTSKKNHHVISSLKHCVWLTFNTFFQPILWKPKTNATPLPPLGSTSQPGGQQNFTHLQGGVPQL